MTLLEVLTDYQIYDSSLAVYAQKINGEFTPDSPARIGSLYFENGGILDEMEIFLNCESLALEKENYTDGLEGFEREWAEDFLSQVADEW